MQGQGDGGDCVSHAPTGLEAPSALLPLSVCGTETSIMRSAAASPLESR